MSQESKKGNGSMHATVNSLFIMANPLLASLRSLVPKLGASPPDPLALPSARSINTYITDQDLALDYCPLIELIN